MPTASDVSGVNSGMEMECVHVLFLVFLLRFFVFLLEFIALCIMT